MIAIILFVWDFNLHFTTTKRQLSKQNVCLNEATIHVNTVIVMIRSDINSLTEMKMKTL